MDLLESSECQSGVAQGPGTQASTERREPIDCSGRIAVRAFARGSRSCGAKGGLRVSSANGSGWVALLLLLLVPGCAPQEQAPPAVATAEPVELRVALFNIRELAEGKLPSVDRGADLAIEAAVRIVRRVRPDVLVVQEIDQGPDDDPAAVARAFAALLADTSLEVDEQPLDFSHVFAGLSNTGRLSGVDLDGDGHVATVDDRGSRAHGGDSFGFGTYPGQYSMAVLSRFPLDTDGLRSFRRLLWKDLPGALIDGAELPPGASEVFRVSSKSHWDLPLLLAPGDGAGPDRNLHLLVSHPTPPGFDGPEDRNGRRNFDELRLWVEYLRPGVRLPEDSGTALDYTRPDGSVPPFVVVGDLNARPDTEESIYDGKAAIAQLLEHPWIQESGPLLVSDGGIEAASEAPSKQYPERSTAVFGDGMRIDYLLPSRDLEMVSGGVYWPSSTDDPEGAELAERASDHRLIWLDLVVP